MMRTRSFALDAAALLLFVVIVVVIDHCRALTH
jgi:hypothetical protein